MVGHNPETNLYDFEWPWLKVKVSRDQKVKIVFTNNILTLFQIIAVTENWNVAYSILTV